MLTTSPTLLGRIASGSDQTAWNRFVELYTPLLVTWCRRIGLSDCDTADFIQDVFLVVLQQMPTFRYDATQSFRAWIKTILLNSWRKRQRRPAPAQIDANHLNSLPALSPDSLFDDKEFRDMLVRRALSVMRADFEPNAWQACWQLVVDGSSAADVAAQLGMTANAVYLAKARVLRRLREELQGFWD